MARPCKKRRICSLPKYQKFYPLDKKSDLIPKSSVYLSLDEFECIRLIDYEGLDQEQCARQMGVARTTIQAIYKSSREKIADSLVNGKLLHITGGEVCFCETNEHCKKRHCFGIPEHIIPKGGNIHMRIAVTYENGTIFQHFGHTTQFKFYDITDNQITETTVIETNGSGHDALAGFLTNNHIDVLICGGIGGGAQMALTQAGIKLYGGVTGDADAAVEAYLKEELTYNPNVKCSHHDHEHEKGHTCGEHGCGNHSCKH